MNPFLGALLRAIDRAAERPESYERKRDQIEAARGSLLEFVRQGWHTIDPATPFVSGYAVQCMAEHLEAVSSGQIKRLLLNVPPGTSKSSLVNVFFPAFEWGPLGRPDHRYISASYAADLAIRDNLRSRDLMESDWFRKRYGIECFDTQLDELQLDSVGAVKFKGDQNAKVFYQNTATGWRLAASVGGRLTGFRGSRIIVDDPHNAQDVESDPKRENQLRWFAETLPTRLNVPNEKDPNASAIIVIMQRLHERDVSGLVLEKELGYVHCCLPMEFEHDHPHVFDGRHLDKVDGYRGKILRDWRTEDGELLWPERFDREAVDQLKKVLRSWGGDYAVAGQLQQRPAPRGGGMFKAKDWRYLDACPELVTAVRGWDLAATSHANNPSAAFTCGALMGRTRDGRFVIADMRRVQHEPLAVQELVVNTTKADGRHVTQDLPKDPGQAGKSQVATFVAMLAGFDVRFGAETGSKESRAIPFAAQVEAGNVYLVRGPWNDDLVKEGATFPNGRFKDQIDACSRAFSRIARTPGPPPTFGMPSLVTG